MLLGENISVCILKIGKNWQPKTTQGLNLVIPFSDISTARGQQAHISKLKLGTKGVIAGCCRGKYCILKNRCFSHWH